MDPQALRPGSVTPGHTVAQGLQDGPSRADQPLHWPHDLWGAYPPPDPVQEAIEGFWRDLGGARGYLEAIHKHQVPRNGTWVFFSSGYDTRYSGIYRLDPIGKPIGTGRFYYAWGNIGRLIQRDGRILVVSWESVADWLVLCADCESQMSTQIKCRTRKCGGHGQSCARTHPLCCTCHKEASDAR